MTTRTDLPDLLLSRLTKGPASVGMLIGYCMESHSWCPLKSEIETAMAGLVAKGKATHWKESRCWSVGRLGMDEGAGE